MCLTWPRVQWPMERSSLLKRSPLAVGRDEIMVAGELEFQYEQFNREHGIPLVKPIVDELIREGSKIGVEFDHQADAGNVSPGYALPGILQKLVLSLWPISPAFSEWKT